MHFVSVGILAGAGSVVVLFSWQQLSRAVLRSDQKLSYMQLGRVCAQLHAFRAGSTAYPLSLDVLPRGNEMGPEPSRVPKSGRLGGEYPVFYWSNGRDYLLWSTGADRATDNTWSLGAEGGFESDIVVFSEYMVQFPPGLSPFSCTGDSTPPPKDLIARLRDSEPAARAAAAASNYALNLTVRPVTRLANVAPPHISSNGGGQGARPSRPTG